MHLNDLDYEIPKELIALHPVKPRDNSKLVVVGKNNRIIKFNEIINELNSSDAIIINNTKVIHAELEGKIDNQKVSINLNKIEDKKTPRAVQTREKTTRRKPWAPPSSLDAPPAPDGFKHRWIRAEVMGIDDNKNLSSRLREGFELVRADSGTQYPTIQEGKYKGVIGVGGLLLARIPVEIVQERMDYFAQQTQDKENAINNDLLKEEHPSMPISKPDRQSRVTFGGNRKD